jgi:hypothetical protein
LRGSRVNSFVSVVSGTGKAIKEILDHNRVSRVDIRST